MAIDKLVFLFELLTINYRIYITANCIAHHGVAPKSCDAVQTGCFPVCRWPVTGKLRPEWLLVFNGRIGLLLGARADESWRELVVRTG